MNSISIYEPIIEAKRLNLVFDKRYFGQGTWKDKIIRSFRTPLTAKVSREQLHILKDLDFTVKSGDRVGILGLNGTGKTSLCRCLATIFSPTSGELTVLGKVRAVFDTSVGMIPELTGRENARLLVELLYSKEIKKHEILKEALEFSELGDLLDTPFKNYSNGMKVRLCLSVVSALPSDILILDEVFEGADHAFSSKVSERILKIIKESGIVIFVSHQVESIARVCNRVIILNEGRIAFDGPTQEGIEHYYLISGVPRLNPAIDFENKLKKEAQNYDRKVELLNSLRQSEINLLKFRLESELRLEKLKLESESFHRKKMEEMVDTLRLELKSLTSRFSEFRKMDTETVSDEFQITLSQLERIQGKFLFLPIRSNPDLNAKTLGSATAISSDRTKNAYENVVDADISILRKSHRVYELTDQQIKDELMTHKIAGTHSVLNGLARTFVEFTEITSIRRSFEVVLHRQVQYRVASKNRQGNDIVLLTPGPVRLNSKTRFSVDFILNVIIDKFENDIDFEIQRNFMAESGLFVTKDELVEVSSGVVSRNVFLLEKIKMEIMNSSWSVEIDGCPWDIPRMEYSSFLWVISNRHGAYYRFDERHKLSFVEELKQTCASSYVCDDLTGFGVLSEKEDSHVQYCWSSIRCKILGLYSISPLLIGKLLFLIDELIKVGSSSEDCGERSTLVQENASDLLIKIEEWCEEVLNGPCSAKLIVEAANFILKYWHGLTFFLRFPKVSLNAIRAENGLRCSVFGRREFLRSESFSSANIRGFFYSIIQTCKQNLLEPKEYLRYIIAENWYDRQPVTPFKYKQLVFEQEPVNSSFKNISGDFIKPN